MINDSVTYRVSVTGACVCVWSVLKNDTRLFVCCLKIGINTLKIWSCFVLSYLIKIIVLFNVLCLDLTSAEGPRFDTASAVLFLQQGCGPWTLSCDFVNHN